MLQVRKLTFTQLLLTIFTIFCVKWISNHSKFVVPVFHYANVSKHIPLTLKVEQNIMLLTSTRNGNQNTAVIYYKG